MRETIEKAVTYLARDPAVSLQQLRLLAERITFCTAENCRLPIGERRDLFSMIKELEARDCVPTDIARSLHEIRVLGNKAAHSRNTVTTVDAREALALGLLVLEWYEKEFQVAVVDQEFDRFRENIDIRLRGIALRPVLPEPRVGSPPTAQAIKSDWIRMARQKTERVLDKTEASVRSLNSWAVPRIGMLSSNLRVKTVGAMRS